MCWCASDVTHSLQPNRNPVPGDRPTFGNIEDLLSGDDEELLDCTPEDVDLADEYSCTLGSNMSTSAQLYPTLQNKYI